MVFLTVLLTSSEAQRVHQAASALWPEEMKAGRLSGSEIIRRFTCVRTELLPHLLAEDRKELDRKFVSSTSDVNGFPFRGRLPQG